MHFDFLFFNTIYNIQNTKYKFLITLFAIGIGFLVFSKSAFAVDPKPLDPTQVQINYLLTDHLGSVRVITDDKGKELYRFNHYPYGEPSFAKASEGQGKSQVSETHQFTGKNEMILNLIILEPDI